MSTAQISCTIGTSDPTAKLGMEIRLNNHILFNTDYVTDKDLPVTFSVSDHDAEHELQFILKNKTVDHTKIDETGNIISDAVITISDLAFEEIELKQIFVDHATYTHDFNGTSETTTTKFYGTMGCNGTVSLKFTTPLYMWLLENI